jgi:hypothetical protein
LRKITSSKELHAAIFNLELEKIEQRLKMERTMQDLNDGFTPSNIAKSTIRQIIGNGTTGAKAVGSSVLGVGSGLVVQKLFAASSKNILVRLVGRILQFAVTGLVAKRLNRE